MFERNSWEERFAREHPLANSILEGATFTGAVIVMSIFLWLMVGDV